MTDIGELVAVANIAADKEKCPFCVSAKQTTPHPIKLITASAGSVF